MAHSSKCEEGPVTRAVSSLTEVPSTERGKMLEGPFTAEIHSKFFYQIPALREIEIGGAGNPEFGEESVRVVAWNVERLTHLDPIADTLKRLRPAVTLLSEVDNGMVRSGNRHRVRELAARLQHVYAYGVEFVELDLGDPVERSLHSGEQNL